MMAQNGGKGPKAGATKNPWINHVKNYKLKHPTMSYKDCMKNAKHTYNKKGSIPKHKVGPLSTKEEGVVRQASSLEIHHNMVEVRPMLKYLSFTDKNKKNSDAIEAYLDRNSTNPIKKQKSDLYIKKHPQVNIKDIHDTWINLNKAWEDAEKNLTKWRPKVKF